MPFIIRHTTTQEIVIAPVTQPVSSTVSFRKHVATAQACFQEACRTMVTKSKDGSENAARRSKDNRQLLNLTVSNEMGQWT